MSQKDQRLRVPEGILKNLKEHSQIKENVDDEKEVSKPQGPKRPDVQESKHPNVQTSKRLDVQESKHTNVQTSGSLEKDKAKRVRHTIYLSPEVSKQLKLEALNTGEEMSLIVENALRELLKLNN